LETTHCWDYSFNWDQQIACVLQWKTYFCDLTEQEIAGISWQQRCIAEESIPVKRSNEEKG